MEVVEVKYRKPEKIVRHSYETVSDASNLYKKIKNLGLRMETVRIALDSMNLDETSKKYASGLLDFCDAIGGLPN